MKCPRCGSTDDVKNIQINGVWQDICFKCYMKDNTGSYGFRISDLGEEPNEITHPDSTTL